MLQPTIDSTDISWFYNNGTEHELTEGTNETRREGGNGEPIVISSTLTISSTIQQNTASLAVGSYYCRIQTPDPTVVSNSSQQFIAQTRSVHIQYGTHCSYYRNFINGENACAVYSTFAIKNPITTGSSENPTTIIMQEDTTMLFIQSIPDQNNRVQEIWIYTLVNILAVFLLIIVILTVFVFRLLYMIPRRSQASSTDRKP